MTPPTRSLLLVEDHELVREGMRLVLAKLGDEWRVLEADTLEAAERALAAEAIELLVLDHYLPDGQGVASIARLRAAAPAMKLVIVSAADDARTVRAAIDAGAHGYVPKSSSADVLLSALRVVLVGGTYVPREALLEGDRPPELTERQLQILRHLVDGKLNQEIASLLCTSESTIRADLTAIYRLLGARNRAHAVQVAIQRRLV